ncbi:unnamed protein product [Closterium sp. NIES-64]|nr:unnamed protein product [Closterium sp. NIES-64]
MKCSVCCKFAPNTKSPFGGAGVGARDFQKSSCRNHDQSKVHLAAMEAERLSEGTEVRQRSLLNMLSSDPVMARVVKCMQGAHWIARNDAPIALYPMLVRFMAEQGCPDMMTDESYAFGEFVEAMAEHLVAKQLEDIKESAWYSLSFDESTDRARGKHLIVYVTFERAEAVVSQFLALLSLERCDTAALHDTIVKCLWSKDMSLDKLVDIIEVKNHVDKVKTKLSQYYVEPGASNGPNTSRLNKFLAAHGSKDKRKMELKGLDENGKHAKAEIELHEDIINPENTGGGCDLEACVDLARRFAQRLIKALGKRMADLRHFDGVGFFSPDKYPDRAGEQDAWVKRHLSELLDMFKNKLPGVALADIEPQMRLFTATMEKKFKKQSFHQALTNISNARSTVQRLTSGHAATVAPQSAAVEGGLLWQQLATGPLSRGGLAQSVRHARVTGSEVKVGSVIERKGRYFQVVKTQHTQQGRGGATIQVELRDVQTGLKSNEKLRTSEHIELVFSDDKPFVFLYVDEDNACLMEKQTFEQISLPVSMFGDAAPLLQDGMEVVVHLFNDKALSASLPARVSDVVDEAEPFFKGQTAAPSYKKVKLRSGITVQVPSFVVAGDEIIVQTSDLTYVTRVKGAKE